MPAERGLYQGFGKPDSWSHTALVGRAREEPGGFFQALHLETKSGGRIRPPRAVAAVRIETMDVEKTMQFLLEQQAVFASQMDELAINLVAIGKAQVRSEQRQERSEQRQERFEKRIEELQIGHEERIRHLEEGLDSLTTKLDRLFESGFSINGGRPQ